MTPERDPPPATDPLRLASRVAILISLLLLIAHGPGFVRTGLNLDALLFELFVRDSDRGAILYRDMVENKPPGMFWAVKAVRAVAGPSGEALKIADLLIVGTGLFLMVRLFPPGRRAVTYALCVGVYFATTEWQHTQADVWCLLPMAAAMHMRLRTLAGGRVELGIPEGFLWGVAVWLKPHVVLAAAAVWLAGAWWARRHGMPGRRLALDLLAVVAGGLIAGAVGVGEMHRAGMWQPFLAHVRDYLPEYAGAKLSPVSNNLFRIAYLYRNAPASLVYFALSIASPVLVGYAVRGSTGPGRVVAVAALTGWAFQAWLLQHVFDYVHTVGLFLAVAVAIDLLADVGSAVVRRGLIALLAVGVLWRGADLLEARLTRWRACVAGPIPPAMMDDLGRFPHVRWGPLAGVEEFCRREQVKAGELMIVSDTAFPLWQALDLPPAGRFYILYNNLLGFRSRRPEILHAAIDSGPIRFVVLDIRTMRQEYSLEHTEDSPLPADWYGPRRWADRVAFRQGPYVVVRVGPDEVMDLIRDVTAFG